MQVMNRPGFFRRFGAYLVDVLVFAGIYWAIVCWCYGISITDFMQAISVAFRPGGEYFLMSVNGLQICYYGIFHTLGGQTPGKALMGIRLVDASGGTVSNGQIFVRCLVFPGLYYVVAVGVVPLLVHAPIWFRLVVIFIIPLVMLADLILPLVDWRFQRCLHDVVAGTRVVAD